MKHRQPIVMLLLFILLITAILAFAVPGTVFGQATIPTRTPTPNPEDPTDPPPDPTDDNSGGNNTPSPTDSPPQSTSTPASGSTNTPIPGGTQVPTNTSKPPLTLTANASPTSGTIVGTKQATITSTPSPTPINQEIAPGTTPISFPVVATAFPKAEPCSLPPTFTTSTTAKVYSGPGEDYDPIETLIIDETRPIVGKALYASWWLIQLDGKFNQGWINDNNGITHGDTENIPEVPSPEIDGATPTPGVPWEPTPVHDCDLTPTATAQASADSDSNDQVISGAVSEDGSTSTQNESDFTDLDSDTNEENISVPTAVPLDIPSAAPTPNLLPIAGLVLIIAAVFIALFLRRNPGGGEPSP